MSVASTIAQRDFSKSTLRALGKRGVQLVDACLLPRNGSCADADRGYLVMVNGQGRVWTFMQVLEAAK